MITEDDILPQWVIYSTKLQNIYCKILNKLIRNKQQYYFILLPIILYFLFSYPAVAAPVTVFVPSQPTIDQAPDSKEKNGAPKSSPQLAEVDILMALMEPFDHTTLDMDMPQFFALLYYPQDFGQAKKQPELINLLGDVEEIRYLNHKAWGANVALDPPGLYQFILETKPWWNEKKNSYSHAQAKVMIPVYGVENGWNLSSGQSFEILPLTRPFGLYAPALFSARLMLDGKPLDNIAVQMGRLNTGKMAAVTPWHKEMVTRSDANGKFDFVLNQPGWWYCEAAIKGAPLKGPDGQMRDLERITVFWLYIDEMPGQSKNKK